MANYAGQWPEICRGVSRPTRAKRGLLMKKTIVLAAVASAAFIVPAAAADMMVRKARPAAPSPAAASPFDIAFGGAIMSDYNFRGISQSDRGPSVFAYFEPRYNVTPDLQLYVGLAGYAVKLPTDPTAEIDIYGGVRATLGALALDVGLLYYYYPRERQIDGIVIAVPNGNTTLADTDFLEFYAKATYTVNPSFALGANLFYTADWLNTGADGTFGSITAKFTAPSTWFPQDWGMYLSAELGHYWLGQTKFDPIAFPAVGGWALPDYAHWNIGVGFTYKVMTLDLRYHDTDLSKEECNVLTADPGASIGGGSPIAVTNPFGNRSKWCGAAFVAKLSFDLTLGSLK